MDALLAEGKIRVVLGYKWTSEHYDSAHLEANIQGQFEHALQRYNRNPKAGTKELVFTPLRADYGTHVFTNIVKEIIAADIAVFDSSDLNPNVMLELGAALVYGVTVLPIRHVNGQTPPSDVSGLTWAAYNDSGERFDDHAGHLRKLDALVSRAALRHRS